jgi:hypothetical protein
MVTLVSVALVLVALVLVFVVPVLVVLVCRVGRHGSPPVPEDDDRIVTDQNHIPPGGIPMRSGCDRPPGAAERAAAPEDR